jgi:hypothetical protein
MSRSRGSLARLARNAGRDYERGSERQVLEAAWIFSWSTPRR